MRSNEPRTVVFVVYPGIVLLDLVGPLQVFTHALERVSGSNGYRPLVLSKTGGCIETNTLLSIDSAAIDDWLTRSADQDIHTLVVVGGDGVIPALDDQTLVAQVAKLAARSDRICSVCSGALMLAQAGLLDGRRAVTHWEDCDRLESQFPAVTVERDAIYLRDGPIWTSAGVTAGIDLALALVTEDLGRAAALRMARSILVPMARSGGQSQFSPFLDLQTRDQSGTFAALHTWLESNLSQEISVNRMAERCAMSARTFARRYRDVFGVSPAKSLEALRVDAAGNLLTSSKLSLSRIALACGFTDADRMRRAFVRTLKTTPADYRNHFSSS